MEEKTTGALTRELMSQANLDLYLKDNQSLFSDSNVAEFLLALCKKNPIAKIALARKAGMSEVYLHQVLSGRRNPSRDRLLCLCLALEATMDEIQALLQCASYARLYPKIRRDAIIIHGIVHHTSLSAINDKLFAEGEKTLF